MKSSSSTPAAFKPSTGWNPYELHATLLPTPASKVDWLRQRREGVGASDCAAILGLDQYSTAFSVWLDKTGRTPLSDTDSEAAFWGHTLEPVIASVAAERLGMEHHQIGGLQSRKRPWQRASLDAVLLTPDDGPVPLEVKNTSQYLASDWSNDQVPDRAELQVQHQMAVTGAPYAFVAGLVGGNRLIVRRVDRDQELIDHLTAEEEAFWWLVEADEEPPIVARDSLADIVAAAGIPDDTGPLVVDDPQAQQIREWIAAYEQASADVKVAETAKLEARNNLVHLAAGHDEVCVVAGDVQHALFRVQRGVFSGKRFEADHPDLAPLYQKKIEVLDTAALRSEDPALFRRYQSRSIRLPKATLNKKEK